jgi:tRNA(fMet)-specific endonuclease VapC
MIDHAVLDKAADLYAELRTRGQLIEDADLLIAAMALVHDMILVTHHTAHFARITGLQVDDWLIS